MMIQTTPRRNGRVIAGEIFGPSGVGKVMSYPDNYATMRPPYLKQSEPTYDPHPFVGQYDVATIQKLPQTVGWGTAQYPPATKPLIQPFEHGTFMTVRPQPLVRRTGNVSANSDTPFHPTNVRRPPATKPARVSATVGEKTNLPSFVSRTRLHVDPNRTQMTPGSPGAGRWDVVKRGAAG